ncbi:uncharacterized protein At3g28850-like [Zingiber officinale]|uniref:Glutaredoxin domain-containing protein n=1 Tax=Zingiber officinale TaxID=94328 RepID=A0A8J5C1N6_ZINOF|nr:uncharacterized protein At3g28850-like [Zingiber officinale]KAG6467042.1 hypothetical protein ZIOFF_075142 [Zingiber officinale]
MGCISSKLFAGVDLGEDVLFDEVDNPDAGGVCPNHFVSLTSTTYGALKLDYADEKPTVESEALPKRSVSEEEARTPDFCPQPDEKEEDRPSEVIDAQELMGDLASETPSRSPAQRKKPPKPSPPMHRSPEVRTSTSPAKPRRWPIGKENTPLRSEPKRSHFEAHRIADPFRSLDNSPWISLVSAMSRKRTPNSEKCKRSERGSGDSRSRRSLSPLFDPELVAMFELQHCEEGKKITTRAAHGKAFEAATLLQSYERRCPGGGENAVVLYTTTLRGIRKTFEDCNAVRSLVKSYGVRVVERDISMDSGYREELRLLMGKKDVKVPSVFVKGRCIGGFEEIARLEDEAKLEPLLEGLPSAVKRCEGCGDLRFVMCMDCNGSCKVLDPKKNKVKCGECNENGLIHCPICC